MKCLDNDDLKLAKIENLKRLANWLKLKFNPNTSRQELISLIEREENRLSQRNIHVNA